MSKTITKTTIGIQKPNNALQWSPTTPRLSKAKSSPNVSKPFTTTPKQIKSEDKTTPTSSKRLPTGNRSGSSKLTTTPLRNTPTSKPRTNITIVQIQAECPTPATRISLTKTNTTTKSPKNTHPAKIPSPRKVDTKKKSKDTPLILEDRALLKKGLQTTPDKLPKKPEELRKKTLNRSTSLWNVIDDDKLKFNSKKINDTSKIHKILDRTNSLWNVSEAGKISRTKSIAGLRPSRIPLSTQFFGLGQSLADLTQVDRNNAERCVQKNQDLDEVDRSMDEHIYANCQETIVRSTNKEELHIYENLKNQNNEQEKKKLGRAKSAPIGSLDLERRAQELMSQLDEDDDPIDVALKNESKIKDNTKIIQHDDSKPKESSKNVSKIVSTDVSKTRNVKIKDVSKSKEDLRKMDILQKGKLFAKSQESLLKKDSEMTIQEIRRNWEMQIKKCKDDEPENESRKNGKKNPLNENKTKRTKDIEHLVKFFNTKNTEATKEVQDSWSKIKESGGSHLLKENNKKEKDEKSSGYVSDGNCSEDSGHMSNENENEEAHHQELKSKRFLEEIIQDLDHSLEHTIEVFEATPIVQRFIPPEEEKVRTLKSSLSTSSGASSIDSWDETLKIQRGNVLEKGNWKTTTTASSFAKTNNGVVSSSVAVVTRRPQIAPKPAPLNTSSQVEISTFFFFKLI